MSRYPWFRMYSEARVDAKLRSLSAEEFRVWFNLLCLASEQGDGRGTVDISDPFILALEVADGDEELLSRTCHALSRLKIIEHADVTLTFLHFAERQRDKPSDAPEQTRDRKRRQREKSQQSREIVDDNESCHAMSRDVTPQEKKREEEKREIHPSGVGAHAFDPPPSGQTHGGRKARVPEDFEMTESTKSWCQEQGYDRRLVERELEKFRNHFTANGEAKLNWQRAFMNWLMACEDRGWGKVRADQRQAAVVP